MMWKDEGYVTSRKKLVSPSLNAFKNVYKVFNHVSKAFSHASKVFNHASKSVQSCNGALFNKWHVYDRSSATRGVGRNL